MRKTSIVARSLIYTALFYPWLVLWMLIALPTLAMPRSALRAVIRIWVGSSMWLLRAVCGVRIEYRGLDKIPPGPLIVASKHQSMWETLALMTCFDAPLYILKRELMRIPLFGWYLAKLGMIDVDRSGGTRTLLQMTRRARDEVRQGRQLIIFPEGTRRPAGAPPDYKPGIAQIYVECGVTCLPVALNSGLFWPRRDFMRYPGTLVAEFLDPLPAGLKRRDFMAAIEAAIEPPTARLVEAGQAEQATLFERKPKDTASS